MGLHVQMYRYCCLVLALTHSEPASGHFPRAPQGCITNPSFQLALWIESALCRFRSAQEAEICNVGVLPVFIFFFFPFPFVASAFASFPETQCKAAKRKQTRQISTVRRPNVTRISLWSPFCFRSLGGDAV